MKIELSDLSGLPEGLKTAVETEDDKSTLDLSKLMVAEDLTGLKSALQKERENVANYSKLGKPDEIQARIQELEENAAKGGKSGDEAQAKLDALKEEYEGKLTGANERLEKVMRKSATAELKAELAKAGVVPEGIDLLANFAGQRIAFNDDGTPKVMTSDGKPMIGNGPDHGATLSDLAKELAGSIPHLVKDEGKGGGGKPPQGNGGTPNGSLKRSEMNAATKAKYIREHGQDAYNKLAE